MKRRCLLMLGVLALIGTGSYAFGGEPAPTVTPEQIPVNPELMPVVPGTTEATPGVVVAQESPLMQMLDGAWRTEHSGGSLVAGAGFYLIQPRFHDNFAFSAKTTTTNDTTTTTSTTQGEFHYDLEFAPRWWIGYVNDCGFGLRMRQLVLFARFPADRHEQGEQQHRDQLGCSFQHRRWRHLFQSAAIQRRLFGSGRLQQ